MKWDLKVCCSLYFYLIIILHNTLKYVGTIYLKISVKAAAAAAKSLQSCPTLCDPIDGSLPGSPSLGFSRQEHWSGLPFPSPVHESEKWKWSRSVVSDSLRPHGLQPTRLLCPWEFPGKSTGVECHCLLHSVKGQGLKKWPSKILKKNKERGGCAYPNISQYWKCYSG